MLLNSSNSGRLLLQYRSENFAPTRYTRLAWLIPVVLVICVLLAGCEKDNVGGTTVIKGEVVDAETGDPVSYAEVRVLRSSGFLSLGGRESEFKTRADGTFEESFEAERRRDYRLKVEHRNYETEEYKLPETGTEISGITIEMDKKELPELTTEGQAMLACWFNEERFVSTGRMRTRAMLNGWFRMRAETLPGKAINTKEGVWTLNIGLSLSENVFVGENEYFINNRDNDEESRITVRLIESKEDEKNHYWATEGSGSGTGTIEIVKFDTLSSPGIVAGRFEFEGVGRDPYGSGATKEFQIKDGRFDMVLEH